MYHIPCSEYPLAASSLGGIDDQSAGSSAKCDPSAPSELALRYEVAGEYDGVARNLLDFAGQHVTESEGLHPRPTGYGDYDPAGENWNPSSRRGDPP